MIWALLTYAFAFTNKLLNADEVPSLFSKGDTIGGGRWGLEIISLVFPDFSMPWIYGIMSIVIMAIVSCVILEIFTIEGKILQILLLGLWVCCSSWIGLFSYMFTSATYAVAILLAVVSVQFGMKKEHKYSMYQSLY